MVDQTREPRHEGDERDQRRFDDPRDPRDQSERLNGAHRLFDMTVNLGHVLSMSAFLVAGGGAYYGTKLQLDFMLQRMDRMEQQITMLTNVTVQLARQDERLTNLGTGLMSLGVRVERLEMRITPTK
jgi:hypothetical protein